MDRFDTSKLKEAETFVLKFIYDKEVDRETILDALFWKLKYEGHNITEEYVENILISLNKRNLISTKNNITFTANILI